MGFNPVTAGIGAVVGGTLAYIAATQVQSASISEIEEKNKGLREGYAAAVS